MSFIHLPDVQTDGSLVLKTTFGDIEIGLWTKQCPKACRNFLQLCNDGYYDGNIFFKVIKDFIAIAGDPTNSGDGGKSIYGEPFKDEIHSRLRFNKRGLLATANTDKDQNNSRFFFTLASTPELQGKHTIFGRVLGESIYNLIKLNDCEIDHDGRPKKDYRILSVSIVHNPFIDIIPKRPQEKELAESNSDSDSSNTSISSDHSENPCISKIKKRRKVMVSSSEDESNQVETLKHDIKNESVKVNIKTSHLKKESDNEHEKKTDSRAQELERIRSELKGIKDEIESCSNHKTISVSSIRSSQIDKSREDDTLNKLTRFRKKLKNVSANSSKTVANQTNKTHSDAFEDDEIGDFDRIDNEEWLTHEFNYEKEIRLAKDANTKSDDWYSLEDPRHPTYNQNRKNQDLHEKHHKQKDYNSTSRHKRSTSYWKDKSSSSSHDMYSSRDTRDHHSRKRLKHDISPKMKR